MQANSTPVKPEALGIIGRDHFAAQLEANGGDMDSLAYKRIANVTDGVPWVVEAAFCSRPEHEPAEVVARHQLVGCASAIRSVLSAMGTTGSTCC